MTYPKRLRFILMAVGLTFGSTVAMADKIVKNVAEANDLCAGTTVNGTHLSGSNNVYEGADGKIHCIKDKFQVKHTPGNDTGKPQVTPAQVKKPLTDAERDKLFAAHTAKSKKQPPKK
jgi:hypothetical protein